VSGAAAGAQAGVGALQIWEAKNSADAIERQSAFEAMQLEHNAKLLEFQKEDIQAQLDDDAAKRYEDARRLIGDQKVTMAAQGVTVEGGIGEQLMQEELSFASDDVQTLKNNAWRQTLGIEIEQENLKTQAKFTRIGGKEKARSTLVTGGLQGLSNIAQGASKMGFKPSRSNTRYGTQRTTAYNYSGGGGGYA